jgi:hypothetical protein
MESPRQQNRRGVGLIAVDPAGRSDQGQCGIKSGGCHHSVRGRRTTREDSLISLAERPTRRLRAGRARPLQGIQADCLDHDASPSIHDATATVLLSRDGSVRPDGLGAVPNDQVSQRTSAASGHLLRSIGAEFMLAAQNTPAAFGLSGCLVPVSLGRIRAHPASAASRACGHEDPLQIAPCRFSATVASGARLAKGPTRR